MRFAQVWPGLFAGAVFMTLAAAAGAQAAVDGARRLGITRVRLREQLLRASVALFSSPK